MKKIAMFLVVLLAAAPAMAVVTVTATQVGTTAEVDITATTSGEGGIPRAFALDITVDNGQSIDSISNFFSGEGTTAAKGYGIFPANFNRFIDADDPCWTEPNYTPVADVNDLPGDTQPGLGKVGGITIEMGSLYKGANSPPNPATLCRIEVSGDCNVGFALNIGRGKIVLEDGNEPSSVVLTGTHVAIVCTVPDIYNMTKADANTAIEAAGFTVGTITGECNDVITAGNVVEQTPAAGAQPACGSPVDYKVSTGTCAVDVPNIVGMLESAAETAVTGAGLTVGTQTYVWDNSVTDCTVTIQNPAAPNSVPPGTPVDMTIARNWSYPACWDYLTQCHGDASGNGTVDIGDWPDIRDSFGCVYPAACYNPCADYNRDGSVNIGDWPEIRDWFGGTPPADCITGDPLEVYKPATAPTGGGC